MKVLIVLIPVKFNNSRELCEDIENKTFLDTDECINEIQSQLDASIGELPIVYTLSEFMTAANDQIIDLDSYFITYVTIYK